VQGATLGERAARGQGITTLSRAEIVVFVFAGPLLGRYPAST
jgi:hypothetical protein